MKTMAKPFRLGWPAITMVLLVLLCARYLPSPQAVFVADDWNNYARTAFYASHEEAFMTGLQDPNRPLSMAVVDTAYRVFGRDALPWTLVSIISNALLVLLAMKMALELTGRRAVAVITGVLFALLPNLTETYHWSTQVANEVACALVFYALSGWMWVAYVRRGGVWRLALSALAYGVGLFSYEAGILLPGAYLILINWRGEPLKGAFRLVPFGLVAILYVAWRVTDAFGTNVSWHYPPHMESGISLWGITWNIRQIVHWWVGDQFFGAMWSGFQSFATLSPWTRRGLVLGNVLVVLLLGWWLRRLTDSNTNEPRAETFHRAKVVLFGVAWTGAAMAIPLVSYTASRLMVLPAMGICLLAALLLVRLPVRAWGGLLFVPAVLAMVANQGTAESYRQTGHLNERLYEHLEQTVDEWKDADALLFDTRSLRNRLTPGLLRSIGEDPATWSSYNNAGLLRAFVPGGMVNHILGERRHGIRIILDVESGARIEGDILHWHIRFDPDRPRTIPISDVYVVDVHEVGMGRGVVRGRKPAIRQ